MRESNNLPVRDDRILDVQSTVLGAGYYGDDAEHVEPDTEGAIRYALSRLERELAPELTYHNLWHTVEDVLPATRRLAVLSGISADDVRLLEVAAAYHDIGFVIGYHDHERAGAEIIAQVLPGFGFTSEQIAAVQGMILATRLPQSPHTPLEEILADADLDVLGREDSLARSQALRSEMASCGAPVGEMEWYRRQLKFFRGHHYFTTIARSLRGEGERRNIEALETRLRDSQQNKLRIDGFVFDLDGTVYLGDAALPGAVEGITRLRGLGKQTLFVSNKPLEPREVYAAKLTRLGIPTSTEQVITSAYVLGRYLARTEPHLRLYVVGEANLKAELRGHGLTVVEELADQDPKQVIDPHGIDAVVIAFDRTLDYRKLNTAYQALLGGARFFATNGDKMCPMPGGGIPDAGLTIAGLETVTGRKLELLAGKPSPLILQEAMDLLRLTPNHCMMVGDRLETDIRMGQQAGMITAVTLTGASRREDVARMMEPPDFVIERLDELVGLIE